MTGPGAGSPRSVASFSTNAPQILAADTHSAAHAVGMTTPLRMQRATRVFLASLLITFGAAAPDVLRQMADELDELAAEFEATGPSLDAEPPDRFEA